MSRNSDIAADGLPSSTPGERSEDQEPDPKYRLCLHVEESSLCHLGCPEYDSPLAGHAENDSSLRLNLYHCILI